MKRLLFLNIFLFLGSFIFARPEYMYNLNKIDISRLLGVYVSSDNSQIDYTQSTFSWGKGKELTNSSIIIDYDYTPLKHYTGYIYVNEEGIPLLIKSIEKIGSSRYALNLFLISASDSLEQFGVVIISFDDSNQVVFDTSKSFGKGLFEGRYIKISGPK
jgi:hypothetical protein